MIIIVLVSGDHAFSENYLQNLDLGIGQCVGARNHKVRMSASGQQPAY